MSLNPFAASCLTLPGFSPLVETEETGRLMRRLPESLLVLPGEVTRRGILALGLPGSGKTTRLIDRVVISSLSQPDASVVVFAVQPGSARQAWAAHASLRPTAAPPAHFNPGDADACTHFINPIAGVRARSEAMSVAQTLCQPLHGSASNADAEYFLLQAITAVGHAIMAVNAVHNGKGTLAHIRDALDDGPRGLKELGEQGEVPALARFAIECLEGNRNSETSLAQVSNYLQWLFHEDARRATSRQEMDFDRLLLKQPGLLVLSVHEEEVPRQRALMSLIFRNLFAWIIRSGRHNRGPLSRPMYIVIDELPAAGRIPDFGMRLTATFRKNNVSVIAAAQCEAQLAEVYGPECPAVIAGFGSRIFVPPIAFSDAERASQRLGTIQIASHITDPHGRLLHSSPADRPLLTPDEIASPPRHPEFGPRILFDLADLPPFFGHLRASWEVPDEDRINELAATLKLPRRRRRTTATSDEFDDHDASSPLTAAAPTYHGWSRRRMSRRYHDLTAELNLISAIPRAQDFWQSIFNANSHQLGRLLQIADQLVARRATIDSLYQTSVLAGTTHLTALFHYLDFQHAKQAASPSPPPSLAQLESASPTLGDEDDFRLFLASETRSQNA